jgi:hypothetical protein
MSDLFPRVPDVIEISRHSRKNAKAWLGTKVTKHFVSFGFFCCHHTNEIKYLTYSHMETTLPLFILERN